MKTSVKLVHRWTYLLVAFVVVLGVLLIADVRQLTARPLAQSDVDAIDAFIESQMRAHRIPGLALAITHGDDVVHLRGFGTAGDERPMTPGTPMYLGSVSKSFTALAIMQLVEQGKIDLDVPVQTYLPWFAVADDAVSQQITVRHLLNHTSGVSDIGYVPSFPAETTLREAVADLRRVEPTSSPGETFYYLNQNYSTLGLLVETVSGQPYGEYVQEHIFAPLAMNQSAAQVTAIAARNVARGHITFFGVPTGWEQAVADYKMPEGGMVSSAEDMAHYLIAQNNGGMYTGVRVLSKEAMTAMHTPGRGTDSAYAMGWMVDTHNGNRVVSHDSLQESFYADAVLLPDLGYGVVFLINQNGLVPKLVAFPQIEAGILDILTGTEPTSGLAVSTVYWIIIAVALITIIVDIRWWRVTFPAWRQRLQEKSTRVLILDIGREFIWPAVLFVGVPALLTALEGRGFTWQRMFGIAPDLMLLLWYGIGMGSTKGIAKLWSVLRQRQRALVERQVPAVSMTE